MRVGSSWCRLGVLVYLPLKATPQANVKHGQACSSSRRSCLQPWGMHQLFHPPVEDPASGLHCLQAVYAGYTCYTGISDFTPPDIEIVGYRCVDARCN